jgi:hypothetical protein
LSRGISVEYRKLISGEAVKGFTAGVVSVVFPFLLYWVGQTWFTGELEYRQFAKNGYLASQLGQQGLTMAYGGKPLKNISIVEFLITNQTSRQFTDIDLVFSVVDSKDPMALVSSSIITPPGLPQTETVEELPAKDSLTKKFRLKVIPKQRKNEYFDAVFVFDGEKAPSMSVVSLSKDVSIGAYQEWKSFIKPLLVLAAIYSLMIIFIPGTGFSLTEHFFGPKRHRRAIKRFVEHAAELRKNGKLKSTDEQVITDAATIYASFTRPKQPNVWSKIFGAQHFDD